jgi:hypothetical protein
MINTGYVTILVEVEYKVLVPADKAAEVQSVITNYAISQLPLDTDFSIFNIYIYIYILYITKKTERNNKKKKKKKL